MNDIECLQKRLELLKKILTITAEQPALIAGDDMDNLLDNVERRQHCIDELSELAKSLSPAAADSAQCRALNDEALKLLSEIKKKDEANEKLASARIEDLKTKMKLAKDGKTTFSGYGKIVSDVGATYFENKR